MGCPRKAQQAAYDVHGTQLKDNDAEWWRFVIYQPHGLDEDPWKQWVHHRSEVEAHRERVLRAISDRHPAAAGTVVSLVQCVSGLPGHGARC